MRIFECLISYARTEHSPFEYISVLSRRRMQAGTDSSSERAAFMGLIALAVSDLCFCASAFPKAFLRTQATTYRQGDFTLYFLMYESYFLNSFSKISTWLTVIMAVSRYVAICHPLHARIFVHAKTTASAIIANFIIWLLLEIPECYTYTYSVQVCPRESYYFVDTGPFVTNAGLNVIFKYLWFVTGFIVPLCILAFCNVHLIQALRASVRMRKDCRVHGGRQQHGRSITPTLVVIVLMFLFLVTPGEILLFVLKFITMRTEYSALIIAITNLLNTLNFSVNFVCYCVVNVHFRSTLIDLMCCCVPKASKHRKRFNSSAYSAFNMSLRTDMTSDVHEL